MARKKEYDREKILDLATKLFWQKGYKATSISDIVKYTGLNKYSLYEEFKNKEGLFQEVLFNYTNKLQKDNIALLSQEPLGLQNIENFLLNRFEYASREDSQGCMAVNSLVEKESLEQESFTQVELLFNAYEDQIFKILEAAKQKGETQTTQDLRLLAKYVVNFSNGVMVKGKTNQTKDDLVLMLGLLMQTLKH